MNSSMPCKSTTLCFEGSNTNEEEQLGLKEEEELKQIRLQRKWDEKVKREEERLKELEKRT